MDSGWKELIFLQLQWEVLMREEGKLIHAVVGQKWGPQYELTVSIV